MAGRPYLQHEDYQTTHHNEGEVTCCTTVKNGMQNSQ